MTLDTWESLDRLGGYCTVEAVAHDAGQSVAETHADLVELARQRAVRRKGRTLFRALHRTERT